MTTRLDCMVTTGVGEMCGFAGLPTLDETPYAERETIPLNLGGDPDNETFGFVQGGFRALGLAIHSLEVYRRFLERHAGHRVFEWSGHERHDQLPPELRGGDRTKMHDYKPPRRKDGYVRRALRFECDPCGDAFQSDSADWVKPFEPQGLSETQIRVFRERVGGPAECNLLEAAPFGILYMDLDDWLARHETHRVTMALVREDAQGDEADQR